jgi:hypothetical protein
LAALYKKINIQKREDGTCIQQKNVFNKHKKNANAIIKKIAGFGPKKKQSHAAFLEKKCCNILKIIFLPNNN